MILSMEAFSFKKGWKKSVSPSVMSDSLQPRGLKPARLLGPWNFPGKNTGVGCHFLLQGIFPTQELNPASEKINVDYTWSKAFIKNMEIWVLKDEEMLWLEAEKNGVMETGKLHLSREMNEYGAPSFSFSIVVQGKAMGQGDTRGNLRGGLWESCPS